MTKKNQPAKPPKKAAPAKRAPKFDEYVDRGGKIKNIKDHPNPGGPGSGEK